jgi:hypothetical protein
LSCADGQVAKRLGNTWVCGTDIDTKLTEAEVDAFVANNGFAPSASLASVATSGRFSDLNGVPTGLADGDNDLLAALSCADGQVAKRLGNTWVCGTDIDTKLTETEVDAFVANNGFVSSSSLSTVATTGNFASLTNVPSDIADGDGDTLARLNCSENQTVAFSSAAGWRCVGASTNSNILFAANEDLQPNGFLELLSPTENVLALAWVREADGSWTSLSQERASYDGRCSDCGTGALGDYLPGEVTSVSMVGGEYNFKNFVVPAYQTITVIGTQPLVIRATGRIEIRGIIRANGGSTSTTAGGIGVAGGFNGGAAGRDKVSSGESGRGAAGGSGGAAPSAAGEDGKPGGYQLHLRLIIGG